MLLVVHWAMGTENSKLKLLRAPVHVTGDVWPSVELFATGARATVDVVAGVCTITVVVVLALTVPKNLVTPDCKRVADEIVSKSSLTAWNDVSMVNPLGKENK